MIRGRGPRPGTGQVSALVAEVEGHLMAQAHLDEARREAEELCAGLPWLTSAQAEDLMDRYMQRRLDFTRRMLRSTVERAAQLRQEYEARYAVLRRDLLRRHAVCACALLLCAGALGSFTGLLVR
ncbi:conserved hypothetical protein [Streptomyces viridosporus ATCC 14672]|uniref:Cytochrome C oxidase subunit I n=3 Tax=Streptomyces viridosporus TaxID=67581 RepID=A0ABX6A9B0_STRVD|nr:conserved hypothetical protein [Streptomyces viridosporus ATCC 14672]QEU84075.1 hypothetical protein CP969_04810 [Streptomyces viridosporus T7A]